MVVMYHRKWCKETVIALKQNKPVKPYYLFLSGPGGVGKSHVVKLIHMSRLGKQDILPSDSSVGHVSFKIEQLIITLYIFYCRRDVDNRSIGDRNDWRTRKRLRCRNN